MLYTVTLVVPLTTTLTTSLTAVVVEHKWGAICVPAIPFATFLKAPLNPPVASLTGYPAEVE